MSVDPLADKYPGWTPYNYTLNNPVRLVDPDGQGPILPLPLIMEGFKYFRAGVNSGVNAIKSFFTGNYDYVGRQAEYNRENSFVPGLGTVDANYGNQTTTEALGEFSDLSVDVLNIAMLSEGSGGRGPKGVFNPKFSKPLLKGFDDLARNPKAIWGKTSDEVSEILGKGWKKEKLNSGEGWKFVQEGKDGYVQYSTKSKHHPGSSYYKINSGKYGKQKIIDNNYKATKNENSKFYNVDE